VVLCVVPDTRAFSLVGMVTVLRSSRLHVAPSKAPAYQKHNRRDGLRQLGGLEVLRGVLNSGVAEEARTRGFATPAFAGCALISFLIGSNVGLGIGAVKSSKGCASVSEWSLPYYRDCRVLSR
jgi:hypothetical protein